MNPQPLVLETKILPIELSFLKMKRFKLTIRYLYELYYRVIYTLFGVLIIFYTSYQYKQVLVYLILPKGITHFISTELTEIFITYLYICALLSVYIGSIILSLQLYLFLKPGLYSYEAKKIFMIIKITVLFYYFSFTILYPILIQTSWEFFYGYTNNFNSLYLMFEPQFTLYLRHIQQLALLIGVSYPFLLCLSLITKSRINLITKNRSVIYILIFLIAAIITPPDPISQIIISIPLFIILEIKIILNFVIMRYKNLIG